MGTSDTARSSLSIKKDYRVLGVAVRDSGARVVFSSTLPVKGKGFERDRCHSQGFSYLDHGTCFE